MAKKYRIELCMSECDFVPGKIIYEDAFQIAVINCIVRCEPTQVYLQAEILLFQGFLTEFCTKNMFGLLTHLLVPNSAQYI